MGRPKGEINMELLAIIAILIGILLIAGIYLALTGFFENYLGKNVNSKVKFCEAFQNVPLFGSMKC